MCLLLRDNYKIPHNDSDIRWKVVEIRDGDNFAFYQSGYKYKKVNELSLREQLLLITNYKKYCSSLGFHVFVNEEDAHILKEIWYRSSIEIKRVKVKDLVASGWYEFYGKHVPCETYKYMEFLD